MSPIGVALGGVCTRSCASSNFRRDSSKFEQKVEMCVALADKVLKGKLDNTIYHKAFAQIVDKCIQTCEN